MRVISGSARGHMLRAPQGMTTRPMSDKIKGAVFSMLSNILDKLDRDWGRVLDLYSGSGSIGIEALSRGAIWADFVEVNAGVCRVIATNLEHTKMQDRTRVNNRNVAGFLNTPPLNTGSTKRAATGLHRRKGGARSAEKPVYAMGVVPEEIPEKVIPNVDPETDNANSQSQLQYDIIFLDPPYADPKIPDTIAHVARSGLVKSGGLVVIGHSPRVVLAESFGEDSPQDNAVRLNLLRYRRHGDSAFSIFIAGDPAEYGFGPADDEPKPEEADEASATLPDEDE